MMSELKTATDYAFLAKKLDELLAGTRNMITNMAQTAALIFQECHDVSWAGFYLIQDESLVLGSYQGPLACTPIPLGIGVCGQVAARQETIIVPDVSAFVGHIACDAKATSEIVVPIFHAGHLWGVLDLDSRTLGRFETDDARGLEQLVDIFCKATDLV